MIEESFANVLKVFRSKELKNSMMTLAIFFLYMKCCAIKTPIKFSLIVIINSVRHRSINNYNFIHLISCDNFDREILIFKLNGNLVDTLSVIVTQMVIRKRDAMNKEVKWTIWKHIIKQSEKENISNLVVDISFLAIKSKNKQK